MPEHTFTIRNMRRQELDLVLDWAAAEGWNPGLHDAECFFAADPGGFLLGLLGGVPVAALFAVRYGAGFAFLGGYIVLPPYRGRGYGKALWDAALHGLEQHTLGLDGVPAQQDNYRKSGFRLAHRNIRFQGRTGGPATLPPAIVPLASLPFARVRAYDKAFFPANRTGFLKCWISQPHSTALGILQDQRLAGYGVLRPCRSGHKIGPLFANSPALADALFLALQASAAPGAPLFLDVPQHNPAALALASRHRLSACFETARMYRGAPPALPLARMFGITSFELG